MGLSKFKDGGPQYWKEKYFKLLDSQEQFEKEQKVTQDLLGKAIVRLSQVTKGFDTSLDPYLARIREVLKADLKNQQLQKELQAFSDAMMSMDVAPSNADASLLFAFLQKFYPDRKDELKSVQTQYEQGQMLDSQSLFLSLAQLLDQTVTAEDEFAAQQALRDCKVIGLGMLGILENVDLPDAFAEDAEQLKLRLLSGQAVGAVFDDASKLLLEVKEHIKAEKQEMADFLSTLTEALTDLGLKASGVNAAHEDAQKKRDNLDRDVAAQMADLQSKSANATQLEPLKQLIGMRLQSISQQIQQHNLKDQGEREKNQRELKALMQRIKEMERETVELKSRLDAAQQKATYDSLTGLPNRQALDDRLAEEIARAKRYGKPLSIAVWDIDFFKNINDTFGHKSGDKALIIIAKLLSKFCRETDFVARFGGEEFVTLLPETEAKNALLVVDKLRAIVERSGFKANGENVSITLSCGLTQYVEGDTNESLFVRADGALYQAKQGGRNQCVLV
ncbi:GGDEF domain-containing protein [Methylomonas rapida]|uniref:diguanylate cyclase n=1 Tax=Methylomonas rapida TaxID=2963939 RepID=A0ABY7GKV4_9GAMM|nr:diguanylate cyclase [Methylomonas rapida]WAR45124.1 diguanylate cyclase [Methylomonas rapida]